MAKGPIVTDEIEALIASVYQQHPKWTAKVVCNEVNALLRKKDQNLPSNWPGLSIVQKILAIVRKRGKEIDPQDKPWSTATIGDNPIPPETLPIVFKVWKLCIEKKRGFTIREAKWTARLSALFEDIGKLYARSSQYARTEQMYEIIDRTFDSTGLDMLLMGMPIVLTKDFTSWLPLLAEQSDGIDQIRDLEKGKRKKIRFDPNRENAMSEESPNLGLGLAMELSEREVNYERINKVKKQK